MVCEAQWRRCLRERAPCYRRAVSGKFGSLAVALLVLLVAEACASTATPFGEDGNAGARAGAGGTAGGGGGTGGDIFLPGAGAGGAGNGGTGPANCDSTTVTAIVRDFRGCDTPVWSASRVVGCASGHPDFDTFGGDLEPVPCCGGIVADRLVDGRPFHNESGPYVEAIRWGQQTTSRERFDEWYRDVDGINQRVEVKLALTPKTRTDARGCTEAESCFVYDSDENVPLGFFPIDGKGLGDSAVDEEENPHNFSFTTEIHTEFKYLGGERFKFSGDDDVWVFINGSLAMDLGGLHPRREDTVSLDARATALGIEVGKTYPLDIFHAERHVYGSNFRIETTIECIHDVPPPS